MGICTSNGVVVDFGGSYDVSEDHMSFGNPTKYWQLRPEKIPNGIQAWDEALYEAADVYKSRMVNYSFVLGTIILLSEFPEFI